MQIRVAAAAALNFLSSRIRRFFIGGWLFISDALDNVHLEGLITYNEREYEFRLITAQRCTRRGSLCVAFFKRKNLSHDQIKQINASRVQLSECEIIWNARGNLHLNCTGRE